METKVITIQLTDAGDGKYTSEFDIPSSLNALMVANVFKNAHTSLEIGIRDTVSQQIDSNTTEEMREQMMDQVTIGNVSKRMQPLPTTSSDQS